MHDELVVSLQDFSKQFVEYFDLIKEESALFCTVPTQHGNLNLLAEVNILDHNETLHIKDLIIYPEGVASLEGKLLREILNLRSQLQIAACHLKFKRLKITGMRVESSTSANPGHSVNLNIDLKFREQNKGQF